MQLIEAPSLESPKYPAIFLGGGITGCADWQAEFLSNFHEFEKLTIYNPRRANFDLTDPTQSEIQINWEWLRLRISRTLVFWYPHETLCPITLWETGAALERNDSNIVIGCHPDYKRKFDVRYQTSLMRRHHKTFNISCHDSLAEVITQVKTLVQGQQ